MKLLLLNHKNCLNLNEVKEYISDLNKLTKSNLIIFPSNIYLPYFLKTSDQVGVQNIDLPYDNYCTGQISISQLESFNIKYAFVGHPNHRIYFQEDDLTINKKIKLLLKHSITPVLFIGETKEEKELNKTGVVLINQLKKDLMNLSPNDIKKVLIVYEPFWAFGTKITLYLKDLAIVIDYITSVFERTFSIKPNILVGGSINENNIMEFNKLPVMGFIIGNRSLNIDSIRAIQDIINK